jgi:hypothetical protein
MPKAKRPSLVENINRRKHAGISRAKSDTTRSKHAYEDMETGWPRKKAAKKAKTNTAQLENRQPLPSGPITSERRTPQWPASGAHSSSIEAEPALVPCLRSSDAESVALSLGCDERCTVIALFCRKQRANRREC